MARTDLEAAGQPDSLPWNSGPMKRRSAFAGHRDRAVDAAAGLVHVEARNRVSPNLGAEEQGRPRGDAVERLGLRDERGRRIGVAPDGLFTSLMP